ncbi:MAG: hypothetical protein KGD58_18120 [Candidatus Lokiarchaeota archaeon]|nr:hypothetical protein [Candidatus Lokiarchaeota archaeon]
MVESNKLIINNISRSISYSNNEFFRDIKREIRLIENKKINYRILSTEYLSNSNNKWHVNDIILHSKGNPEYFISFSELKRYEKKLIRKLDKDFGRIQKYFEKYRIRNPIKPHALNHPNLIKKFFEKVENLKKAYWLGWLYAEAHFSKKNLRVEINIQDAILIRLFVEDLQLNPQKIRLRRRYDSKTTKYQQTLKVTIYNQYLRDCLEDIGLNIGKKAGIIRFPDFSNSQFFDVLNKSKLEMAFLLGFFDGDGSHSGNTPRIYSTSKDFLHDIVEVFHLPDYIFPKPKFDLDGNLEIYYLNIGAELFMKLLENYGRSLPRKRIEYWRFCGRFLFTRNELLRIVNENPEYNAREIADLHLKLKGVKVAKRTVNIYIKDWHIERIPKDEYYRNTIIKLRKRGLDLKEIWINSDEGLGFTKNSWDKNRWRFFKRIFKDDIFVKKKEGSIKEKIEQSYEPVEAKEI